MIYRQLVDMSIQKPEKLKIIRVKNRLRAGTNDILLNIKFNEIIISEIQLKVNNKQESKFIACSNDFSHYIYELQRSFFGPISELCNIWNNSDARASQLEALINSNLQFYDPYETLAIPPCTKGDGHLYSEYISPFQCSICTNFYFHNNYILSNKQCQNCLKFYCVRCQIKALNSTELKNEVFRNKKDRRLKEACNKLSSKAIPAYGVCFKLESSQPRAQVFRYMKVQSKHWLFGRDKSGDLYEIQKVESGKQISKFMREYCIFNLVKDPTAFMKIQKR